MLRIERNPCPEKARLSAVKFTVRGVGYGRAVTEATYDELIPR
ncbi:MAG: hypothetical protein QXU65_07000 [Sulfolobales archaeon]